MPRPPSTAPPQPFFPPAADTQSSPPPRRSSRRPARVRQESFSSAQFRRRPHPSIPHAPPPRPDTPDSSQPVRPTAVHFLPHTAISPRSSNASTSAHHVRKPSGK